MSSCFFPAIFISLCYQGIKCSVLCRGTSLSLDLAEVPRGFSVICSECGSIEYNGSLWAGGGLCQHPELAASAHRGTSTGGICELTCRNKGSCLLGWPRQRVTSGLEGPDFCSRTTTAPSVDPMCFLTLLCWMEGCFPSPLLSRAVTQNPSTERPSYGILCEFPALLPSCG